MYNSQNVWKNLSFHLHRPMSELHTAWWLLQTFSESAVLENRSMIWCMWSLVNLILTYYVWPLPSSGIPKHSKYTTLHHMYLSNTPITTTTIHDLTYLQFHKSMLSYFLTGQVVWCACCQKVTEQRRTHDLCKWFKFDISLEGVVLAGWQGHWHYCLH